LVWTGQTPFEMKTIKSMPDGFEIEFTQPTNKKTASDIASYKISSFTYKYHHTYGSPIINTKELNVRYIQLSNDGLKARIVIDSLREGYIHEVKAEGVLSATNQPLLHNFGYYTLNSIAKGEKIIVPANAAINHNNHTMPAVGKTEIEPAKTKTETNNKPTTTSTKRLTEAPAEWKNAFDQVVILGTKPGLKYDVSEVQVKAGSRIKWVFNNNDDMLHNCVIVSVGTSNYVGEAAIKLGLKGADMQYVPNSKNVLFHTNILQPDSSETIYFMAPTETGDYSFLCTFPGHHTLMLGKLKVVK
jgi:azurin